MRTKLLSALLLCFAAHGLFAQTSNWTRYSRQNTGMIGQNPNKLVFDHDNDMFVAFVKGAYDASTGISEFNGNTWRTYNFDNYSTDGVMDMTVDSNNVVWAIMFANANSDHVIKIDNGVTTVFNVPHAYRIRYSPDGYLYINDFGSVALHQYDLDFNYLGMIFPPTGGGSIGDYAFDPADSTLWAITTSGLWHYDGTNWTGYTTGNSTIPFNSFHVIAVDHSNVWLGHNTSGVTRFDKNSTFTHFTTSTSTLPSDQVYSLHSDRNGNALWIGAFEGLIKFDLNSTFELFETDTIWPRGYTVNDIEQDNNGKIHIVSGMVAASFDGASFDNVWNYVNTGLPDFFSTYYSVKVHPQTGDKYIGNASAFHNWPGYTDGGLTIFNDSVWTSLYPQNSPLVAYKIWKVFIDSNNNTWIVTENGLQMMDASGNFTTHAYNSKAIAEDSTGNIWVGSWNGLAKWNGSTWTNYTTADGLPVNDIEDLDVDHNGVLWIATNNGGVVSYDGTSFTVYNSSNSGLAMNIVYEIDISPSNEVYAGTHFGTFQKLSGGNFTTLGTYASNIYYDIEFSADSTAWIAADNGLWLHHPNGTYTYYSASNSPLLDSRVYDIEHDGLYKTWLATHSGLYIIDNTPTVEIDTVMGSVFCAGDSVRIAYSTMGSYIAGNTFTAVLSDAAGSFTPGINIGSISQTETDTILAVIPSTLASGTAYRIMIRSNAPASTSTDNGSDLIIHALPTATVMGDTAFCQGGTATLSTGSFVSYLWSTGETTSSIAISMAGGYFATVTDTNGCSNLSDTAHVIERALPTSFIQVDGPSSFCQGDTTMLYTDAAFAAYLWNTGDTVRPVVVTTPGDYSAQVTDIYGCVGTTDTVTITVHALPLPVINVTGSLSPCQGDTAVLNAGAGFVSYAWSTGQTTQTISTTTGGSFSAAVTDANGCTGRTDTVTVTVLPLPSPAITGNNDTLYATGAASYQWYKDGVLIPGATSSFFDVVQNGVYTVVATGANGCQETSAGFTYNGTGIDAADVKSISLYPNPSTGLFTIRSMNTIDRIEIVNIAGERVLSQQVMSNDASVNLEGFSKGIYFAEIHSEGKITMKKVILQ